MESQRFLFIKWETNKCLLLELKTLVDWYGYLFHYTEQHIAERGFEKIKVLEAISFFMTHILDVFGNWDMAATCPETYISRLPSLILTGNFYSFNIIRL